MRVCEYVKTRKNHRDSHIDTLYFFSIPPHTEAIQGDIDPKQKESSDDERQT